MICGRKLSLSNTYIYPQITSPVFSQGRCCDPPPPEIGGGSQHLAAVAEKPECVTYKLAELFLQKEHFQT
jgi:hypothetical protein